MCLACIIHLPQPAFYIDQQKSLHHLLDRSLPTIGPQKHYLVFLRIKMSLADEEVDSNWGSQYLMMMKVHILIIMFPLFRKTLTVASWQLTALELPLMFGRRWELACWQPVIVVCKRSLCGEGTQLSGLFCLWQCFDKECPEIRCECPSPLSNSPPSHKKTISSWRKSSSAF